VRAEENRAVTTHEPTPVSPLPGRYLITGGSGFIGAHLTRRLLDAGCAVTHLDVLPPTVIPEGVRYVRCDLRDRAATLAAVAPGSVDYAVHLAARVGDHGTFADFEGINVTGTRNTLEALTAAGAKRIVHISSIAAMGLDAGPVADESVGPFASGDPYSATKGAGEMVAREFQRDGGRVVIARPGDVYGVGSVPWVVRPVELMRKGQMLLIEGGCGHFAHVHVDNLLDGLLLALARDGAAGETFIFTDGDTRCTIGEYFTRLADAAGVPRPTRSVPRAVARAVGLAFETAARVTGKAPAFTRVAVDFTLRRGSFRIDKARDRLGWSPRVTFDEGLSEIASHYRRT
jgi:nucleoside-diphosphate-sugar epimerase